MSPVVAVRPPAAQPGDEQAAAPAPRLSRELRCKASEPFAPQEPENSLMSRASRLAPATVSPASEAFERDAKPCLRVNGPALPWVQLWLPAGLKLGFQFRLNIANKTNMQDSRTSFRYSES